MHKKSFYGPGQQLLPDQCQNCAYCTLRPNDELHRASSRELPWFEHWQNALATEGQHYPYAKPELAEIQRIQMLRRYVRVARPPAQKADRFCSDCDRRSHSERLPYR
ncbi:DUF7828 domain-containing protein [Serratia fonticola]